MKRLIYLILLLFGLSGCKTEQQEVQESDSCGYRFRVAGKLLWRGDAMGTQ